VNEQTGLDEGARLFEARAKAILDFINSVCLPEGTMTIEEIEDLDEQVSAALIRIDHDLTKMEALK
jgi:hypothetical protein